MESNPRSGELNTEIADQRRGLTVEALIDAEREGAVQRAIAAARDKAATDQVRFNNAQAEAIRQQIDAAQRGGDTNLAGMLEEELGGVNTALDQAISKAIAFWSAMGGPEAEAAIAKLKGIQITVGDTGRQFLMAGNQINELIANGAASAFDRFAKNIAEGKNAFKSLKDAFLQFAADFPRQIAQMISQQAAFNAVSVAGGGASSSSGGAGGGIAGFGGGHFHNGGIVDVADAQRGRPRLVQGCRALSHRRHRRPRTRRGACDPAA